MVVGTGGHCMEGEMETVPGCFLLDYTWSLETHAILAAMEVIHSCPLVADRGGMMEAIEIVELQDIVEAGVV